MLAIAATALIVRSCGIYSFTGTSIQPDIKTVTIDYFEYKALKVNPTLSNSMTESLKDKFRKMTRDDMKHLIELHGGKNSSSLSGKTSYLLAGSKPGPEKLKKAEQLGVKVISEDEFRSMLPEGAMPETEEDIEPDLFGGAV